jgi:hypothetical protein
MKPRIQRVLTPCNPKSSASAGVQRASGKGAQACSGRPAGGWRAWVLALDVRDLGAAGLLRDRDQRGGTALLPAAVTTACG